MSQQAKGQRVNRGCHYVDAPVAENKLAQMRVMAAKLPTGVVPLARHWEQRSRSASVADGVMPIVKAAVPRMRRLSSSWHVLFSEQQGVAQAVSDFGKSYALDRPEGAVLINGLAARKANRVIEACCSRAHRVIAHRT